LSLREISASQQQEERGGRLGQKNETAKMLSVTTNYVRRKRTFHLILPV